MMSLDFIAEALDGDADFTTIDKFDFNGDGEITADDCPFQRGSPEAKLWWNNVLEPYVTSRDLSQYQEQYGDNVVGEYKGKPLVPGVKGSAENPQGDSAFSSLFSSS